MFINPLNQIYDDIIYIKSLYPDNISLIYEMVSDESDKLEYDKSIMYDEFPDKERIRLIAERVEISLSNENSDVPPPHYSRELIEVLLLNEFVHRRIRRRHFQ